MSVLSRSQMEQTGRILEHAAERRRHLPTLIVMQLADVALPMQTFLRMSFVQRMRWFFRGRV